MNQKILVALTTYAGDIEQRLILKKVIRHLRAKNGNDVFLLVISDGFIKDKAVHNLADIVLSREGPKGLQEGELESISRMIAFAKAHQFKKLIKIAGDVIMTEPNWAKKIMKVFKAKKVNLLSTHWNDDNSWIVGTKFFVADVNFIEKTIPKSLKGEYLENAFTRTITKYFKIKKFVYLINSTTGYRNEVKNELKNWGWEHSHRINKFIYLDEYLSHKEKFFNRLILYPSLKAKREINRLIKKILKN